MMSKPRVSVVIPVYNGSMTIGDVVADVKVELAERYQLEMVLVNDGSSDDSAQTCKNLAGANPGMVIFVNLAKNFGEHNAVLAGVCQSTGDVVVIIDDDGQNPPSQIPLLVEKVLEGYDVVYGNYAKKKHAAWRNWGSQFNDYVATLLIHKPKDLYLSSFKAFNRFTANEIASKTTPYPYIDSLIFKSTSNICQVTVEHKDRESGESNYNMRRLVRLWLNMLTTASILPLRMATYLGLIFSFLGFLAAMWILLEKAFFGIGVPGWTFTALAILVFGGIQLFALGMMGEYIGRIFQAGFQKPFVVREIVRVKDNEASET